MPLRLTQNSPIPKTHTEVTIENATGCSYNVDTKQVSDELKACTQCFDKWEALNNFVLQMSPLLHTQRTTNLRKISCRF